MDRVTLAGLLELAIWAEVEACLQRHYYPGPNDVEQQANVTAHQRVYEALRELQAEPSDGLLIEITLAAGEPDEVDAFDAHGVLAESGERVAMDFQRGRHGWACRSPPPHETPIRLPRSSPTASTR